MTSAISSKTRWHVQCTSALSKDTSPSLMLIFDDARYLINCGENFTRTAVQDRISLKKLKHVFLSSSTEIQSTSGLGGLLLSIGEREGAQLDVHGPEGTDQMLASMRFHTRRQKLKLRLHQLRRPLASATAEEEPAFQDTNITVWATPVLPETSATPAESVTSKRRSSRSSSPRPAPSERSNLQASAPPTHSAEDLSEGATNGHDLDWFARGFDPTKLEGTQAASWRRVILCDMFRSGELYVSQPDPNRWQASPAWNLSSLPPYTPADFAVSYLVVGPQIRGQFLPQEAKAQGVKPGPDFSRLTAGEAIILPNGEPIDLARCFTPGGPSSAFAIVSCPGPEYITNTLSSNPLRKLPADANLKYMFHHLGEGVLENEAYVNWLAFLPPDVQHIISAPSYSPNRISFSSAALLQLRLSRIDSQVFQLPDYQLHPARKITDVSGRLTNVKVLEMGDTFNLNGKTPAGDVGRTRHFDFESTTSPEAQAAEAKLNERNDETKAHSKEVWTEYVKLAEEARQTIAREKESKGDAGTSPGADIQVTTLGTGSAMPSKYRNVSSSVLRLPSGQTVLLDAGEGTMGQLARRFGPGCDDLLRSIHFIFISHMHADHHSGLASVLKQRARCKPTHKLFIACPPQVRTYIRDIDALQSLGLNGEGSAIHFIDNHILLLDRRKDQQQAGLYNALGVSKVETVLVEHRTKAFGIVIESRQGWKIVYSGDTQPCQALVQAGKGATLLIHEATIEDELPELARSKGHSTFAEAIQIAKDMNARHCLLTHFSQRYPKFPPLSESEEGQNGCQVAVAFDLMSLKISDFWKFRHFVKPLQVLFSEMEADDGADAAVPIDDGSNKGTSDGKAAKPAKQKQKQKQQKKGKESATNVA